MTLNSPKIFSSTVFEPLISDTLEVRLAENMREMEEAQSLRYRVFVEEMGACASGEMKEAQRDWDEFDQLCDHLLVLDWKDSSQPQVVGTYRLLRRSNLPEGRAFYTESEFSLVQILKTKGEILELGRSCVEAPYRSRAVMQLLWRGIGAYVERFNVRLMFGCASFPGAKPEAHAQALSYLYHYHLAPEHLRMQALESRFEPMNLIGKETLDVKRSFAALPALIKGYLRLGGYIGDGAVIDHDYNTTDVGIVVETERVTGRYADRYGGEQTREIVKHYHSGKSE